MLRRAGMAGLVVAVGAGLMLPAAAGATGAPTPNITIPTTAKPKTRKTTTPRTTTPRTTTPNSKAPKVTGNAAAIAFYRKVVKATAATEGVEEIYPPQQPLTQAKFAGKRLSWAEMQSTKAGFSPATDVVFVGAEHGKVTFVADTVLYAGKGAIFPDFGLLLTAKGEVLLASGAAARTGPVGKKTPVYPCAGGYSGPKLVAGYDQVGIQFGYSLIGHFDKMKLVDKGKAYQVTSTYPWFGNPAQTATEVDTVPVATDLPALTVIHVSAAGKFTAFTMREANVWVHQKLYPPATNGACAAYVKGVP